MKDSSARKQNQSQIHLVDNPVETPKSNFKSFLKEIRKKAKSEREKGDLFERAIRDFLKASPEHSF